MPTYLATTNDIIHDVLVRCDQGLDSSTDTDFELYNQVLAWINRAYRLICQARTDWRWLRKTGTFSFLPDQASGTVTATANSSTITFSSAQTNSVANYIFHIPNTRDTFRIATHTAASATATLDSVYTGSTVSGASYHLLKTDYGLASDYVRLINPLRLSQSGSGARYSGEMTEISEYEMGRDFPIHRIRQDVPSKFCFVNETTVRINAYPATRVRAEYDYHYRPDDLTAGSTPILPVERRSLLADFATAMLLDSQADARADKWLQLANLNINNFIAEYDFQMVQNSPYLLRIFPRANNSYGRTILHSSSGLHYR